MTPEQAQATIDQLIAEGEHDLIPKLVDYGRRAREAMDAYHATRPAELAGSVEFVVPGDAPDSQLHRVLLTIAEVAEVNETSNATNRAEQLREVSRQHGVHVLATTATRGRAVSALAAPDATASGTRERTASGRFHDRHRQKRSRHADSDRSAPILSCSTRPSG